MSEDGKNDAPKHFTMEQCPNCGEWSYGVGADGPIEVWDCCGAEYNNREVENRQVFVNRDNLNSAEAKAMVMDGLKELSEALSGTPHKDIRCGRCKKGRLTPILDKPPKTLCVLCGALAVFDKNHKLKPAFELTLDFGSGKIVEKHRFYHLYEVRAFLQGIEASKGWSSIMMSSWSHDSILQALMDLENRDVIRVPDPVEPPSPPPKRTHSHPSGKLKRHPPPGEFPA